MRNPVDGIILPRGVPQTWPQFHVTNTSAEHLARGDVPAIDLGNGRAGSPVYAMRPGKVEELRPTLDGVVTLKTTDGWRDVYAHMTGITVLMGEPIAEGRRLGFVGAVSPIPINAHLHLQIGRARLFGTVWEDPWPYMNPQEDDVQLKGALAEWIVNRTCYLTQPAPAVDDPTAMPYRNLAAFPVGQAFTPLVKVNGNVLLGDNDWYGGWITGNPPVFAYVPKAACGPLQPIEYVAGGERDRWLDWLNTHP